MQSKIVQSFEKRILQVGKLVWLGIPMQYLEVNQGNKM